MAAVPSCHFFSRSVHPFLPWGCEAVGVPSQARRSEGGEEPLNTIKRMYSLQNGLNYNAPIRAAAPVRQAPQPLPPQSRRLNSQVPCQHQVQALQVSLNSNLNPMPIPPSQHVSDSEVRLYFHNPFIENSRPSFAF
jgi:hypothetical protein